MNSLEEQIQTYARRIQKIEASPDPRFLKSNKQLYELEKERAEAELDAWQRGKPYMEARHFPCLVRSMGFQWGSMHRNADRSRKFYDYKAIIERLGFPASCCEHAIMELAMCEAGDLPKPRLMLAYNYSCGVSGHLVESALGRWNNIPVFYIDASLDAENKPNLDSLNYIADQLGEFIEWAEKKVPGFKYDEDRLREIQELEAIGLSYFPEIYQLRKHVPCPIAPLDAFRMEQMPSRYPNIQKANEYYRICRDELRERVASRQGPYPEERLRVLWANSGPFSQVFNPFRVLEERKVAMPLIQHGANVRYFGLKYALYGSVSEYGVQLSPLQEEAKWASTNSHGATGKRWVQDTLDTAGDIGAHGIVHFLQMGCVPVLGVGSLLADRAEKELGIPVLNIEGRQMDPDYMTQEQFEEILSAFIDKCFEWAGKPRQ